MIVRVVCEDGITDVPITPDTTCFDVVECCRDPGDDLCSLVQVWRNYGLSESPPLTLVLGICRKRKASDWKISDLPQMKNGKKERCKCGRKERKGMKRKSVAMDVKRKHKKYFPELVTDRLRCN
ncbi:hypothetical protein RUM44_013953 [Polyplax serrata]|uniref:Apoptosis-stimulating of p53 protein 2-like RA domain-containing protein n=1 Tax=Polyplax serrata TaxID=468196 RepID=A0ABR1BJV4_POLSC